MARSRRVAAPSGRRPSPPSPLGRRRGVTLPGSTPGSMSPSPRYGRGTRPASMMISTAIRAALPTTSGHLSRWAPAASNRSKSAGSLRSKHRPKTPVWTSRQIVPPNSSTKRSASCLARSNDLEADAFGVAEVGALPALELTDHHDPAHIAPAGPGPGERPAARQPGGRLEDLVVPDPQGLLDGGDDALRAAPEPALVVVPQLIGFGEETAPLLLVHLSSFGRPRPGRAA